ncbi:MAG: hypothetical protein IPN86_04455 [Saprospiraceae bacterium]|nr:hypothetical protein [Saprospiraceae bacterium]
MITVPTLVYLSNMPLDWEVSINVTIRQDRVSQIGIQRERDMGSDNFGACDLPDFCERKVIFGWYQY